MNTQARWRHVLLAAAGTAAILLAAPTGRAATPVAPPATTPATTPPAPAASIPALQTTFESGDPIGGLFTALALRFHVMVVEIHPVKAYVLKDFTLPDKLEDALTILHQTLEAQGFGVSQSAGSTSLVLRIGTAKETAAAQQSEGPVTFGREPEKIDISKPKQLVTHIMPIENPTLRDTLRRNAASDPEVSAEVIGTAETGLNLLIMGPAIKVQAVVVNLAKVDVVEKTALVARTMALKRLNAQETAQRLNEAFARDTAPMKAVAEPKTNAIVITGPEDKVMAVVIELMATEMTPGPGAAPVAPPPPPREVPLAPESKPAPEPESSPGASAPGTAATMGRPLAARSFQGGFDGRLDALDEGGDNAAFTASQWSPRTRAVRAPFVNKGAFRRDSKQLGGRLVV